MYNVIIIEFFLQYHIFLDLLYTNYSTIAATLYPKGEVDSKIKRFYSFSSFYQNNNQTTSILKWYTDMA